MIAFGTTSGEMRGVVLARAIAAVAVEKVLFLQSRPSIRRRRLPNDFPDVVGDSEIRESAVADKIGPFVFPAFQNISLSLGADEIDGGVGLAGMV